jgi:hypothetical protein
MRRIALITFSVLLPLICCFSQDAAVTSGSIRGDVFTQNEGREPLVLPGARVALRGPVTKETQSDEKGDYAFDAVPAGTYTVEAQAPGLGAELTIEVKADETTIARLELQLDAVKSTVTVTADAPAAIAETAQTTTIRQSTLESAPNQTERFESLLPLVPGVVRGPDGRINMKGSRSTQSGWLVNSANVTDPATGAEAINLPIDVVSSVQVISNPYDPKYGKFTGAISSVETRTGDVETFHISVQNFLPRIRVRDGDVVGIGATTPRVTITGPLVKDRLAFTQSFEYRFVRTPVESLPPMQRDTKLESLNSFSQLDWKINPSQTATFSLAVFPQKLAYLGLNTFTPQPSTSDLHERGYQASFQHRYVTKSGGLVSSQFAYEKFDADVLPNGTDPYRLLVETTTGGFFDRQNRDSNRVEWQETFESDPKNFHGTHQLKAGFDFSHSSYDGRRQFLPVDIVGTAGYTLERITFGAPAVFSVHQNEFSWFVGDQWTTGSRLTFDLGLRFDRDSVTDSTHTAPRAGFTLALTGDRRTLLKAGAGLFYDRVPLNIPAFPVLPDRTILWMDPTGGVLSSTTYANAISGGLRNPRSTAWNVEIDRQILNNLLVRVGYQQRNTSNGFSLTPLTTGGSALLSLSNSGSDSYREFQVTGVYQVRRFTLNGSYVRSRAYGDLNDFNQFFGNEPQAIIQPDARARLSFDAPNRYLAWGEIAAPWKLTVMPVLDVHTGFPYSVENQMREFVGPRNDQRYPRFASFDLQVLKQVKLPFLGENRKAKVGFGVFNVFNHFDPREVQNDLDSYRFGSLFNGVPRTFRGKLVVGF